MTKKKKRPYKDHGLVYWDKNGVKHTYESPYLESLEREKVKAPVVLPKIAVIQNTKHQFKSKNKRTLNLFWSQFKSALTAEMKIKLLRELAEVVRFKYRPETLQNHRRKFDKKKHKIARLIGGQCAVCMGPANVRHHIIQLQNGGLNQRRNIVLLCNRCHAEIHPWLKAELYETELQEFQRNLA